MAYNKKNYEDNRLTPKQEKFVSLIAEGKTQYEAYITAYPTSKKWSRNAIDTQASQLMSNSKIILRLNEYKKLTEQKVEWTRTRALNEINYVLEINKQDIERQQQAYDTELEMLETKLIQLSQRAGEPDTNISDIVAAMNEINENMTKLRQKRRVSSVNTNGILNAAKVLNRMYGYDITKVEINPTDEETENMKKLSVEELKAIAYANINGTDSNKS